MVAEIGEPTIPLDDFAPVSDPDAPYGRKKDGTPAKRRGRQPGSHNIPGSAGRRGRTKDSLKTQIGAMLVTFNMPLRMLPMTQIYALDASEIEALATAIDTECQNNASFRRYVVSALNVQGVSSLVGVVAVIAGRRVIRAGFIPDEILAPVGGKEGADAALGVALPMMTAAPMPPVTIVTGEPADAV